VSAEQQAGNGRSGGLRRGIIPAVAAVAVLAVAGGSGYALTALRDDQDGKAPPLRLTSTGVRAPEAPGETTDSNAFGRSAGVTYRLTGRLPDGPAKAKVYRLADRPLDTARVRLLAGALGLTGLPRDTGDAWVVGGVGGMLRVAKHQGQQWALFRMSLVGRCIPTLKPGVPSRSVPGGSAATPDSPIDLVRCRAQMTPQPRGVTPEQARRLARPVFDAVGVPVEDARLTAGPGSYTLTVDPAVSGRPTTGLPTVVVVEGRSIESAQGWLARPEAGAAYPVITAKQAFEALGREPSGIGSPAGTAIEPAPPVRPSEPDKPIGQPCLPPAGTPAPGACTGTVLEVVGARFGYSLQWQGADPVLVPSWLFDLARSAGTVAQVAVEPDYLAPTSPGPGAAEPRNTASPDPDAPVTGPAGPVGTPVPDPGGSGPAPPPGAESYNGLTRITRAVVGADGTTLTLTVNGGPAAGPCRTVYTAWAKRDGNRVVIAVQGEVAEPFAEVRCNTRGNARTVTLRLDGPVAGRTLVDGATGQPVPSVGGVR